jgi:hypothetical protein
VDLTQDKFNSSQSFNTASQFLEDMFSDDSIERAAALIEEDQSTNKDENIISNYTANQTEAHVAVSADVSAVAQPVADYSFLTQSQGNISHSLNCRLIRLKRIYNFLCSMLVFTLFS